MLKVLRKFFVALAILSITCIAAADSDFHFFILLPSNDTSPPFQILQVMNPGSLTFLQSPTCNLAGCSYSVQDQVDQSPGLILVRIGQDNQHYCSIQAVVTPDSTGFLHIGTPVYATGGNVKLLSLSYCTGWLDYHMLHGHDKKLIIKITK